MPKSLVIFVEGPDDKRFVEKVFKPRLKRTTFSALIAVEYAQMEDEALNTMLSGFNDSRANFDYIFLRDQDNHRDQTACRTYVKGKHPAIEENQIYMVCAEIESWYLAGIAPADLVKFGIRISTKQTDAVTKEQFNRLIPVRYRKDRYLFLINILKTYNLRHAKSSNKSFKAFCAANQAIISGS